MMKSYCSSAVPTRPARAARLTFFGSACATSSGLPTRGAVSVIGFPSGAGAFGCARAGSGEWKDRSGGSGLGKDQDLEVPGVGDGGLDGMRRLVQREAVGDDPIDVDDAGRGQGDRGGEGVGVAERGDQVDLVALQIPEGQAVDPGGGLADDGDPAVRADR